MSILCILSVKLFMHANFSTSKNSLAYRSSQERYHKLEKLFLSRYQLQHAGLQLFLISYRNRIRISSW